MEIIDLFGLNTNVFMKRKIHMRLISSESYEATFPILYCFLNVPILGLGYFLGTRTRGGNSGHIPRILGWKATKFGHKDWQVEGCVFHMGWGWGVNQQLLDRDSSHLATLCWDLMRKSNDEHTNSTHINGAIKQGQEGRAKQPFYADITQLPTYSDVFFSNLQLQNRLKRKQRQTDALKLLCQQSNRQVC